MIRTEGIQFLFELANGLQAKPANYYIGFCEESEDQIPANASLGDLTELTGNGYGRQAVPGNSTGMVSAAGGTNGRTLTTAEATFTASGGAWNLAKTKFLATSADDSGKLIATEPINAGSGVALGDGESYDVAMTIASEP
ncbi:MAG: hypothetical protein ABFE13_01485 [Phycisphaerales bacterium]